MVQHYPSDPFPFPVSAPGIFNWRLHLVAGLESAWISKPGLEPELRELETWLACDPGVCLTLISGFDFDEALALAESQLDILPHNFVSSGGTRIHHLIGGGVWEEDLEYGDWLGIQRQVMDVKTQSLPVAPVAVDYLEIQWTAPRPLVVLGSWSSEADLLILADMPVPIGDYEEVPVGLLRTEHQPFTGKVGRKGLLDLLRSRTIPGVPVWEHSLG